MEILFLEHKIKVQISLDVNYMDPMRKVLADWTQEVPESEIRRLLKSKCKYYLVGGLPGNLPTKVFPEISKELAEYYNEDEKRVVDEFQYG